MAQFLTDNQRKAIHDLDRVAALLGHENLNTTCIYTTPPVHDLTKAVERLEGE